MRSGRVMGSATGADDECKETAMPRTAAPDGPTTDFCELSLLPHAPCVPRQRGGRCRICDP
jgi:hypothetical protein